VQKISYIRNNVIFGLLLLFVGVYLLPLNSRPLSIPDEMRYGEIAREMLESGDFVVPYLNGLRYFEKPAGGHVLNAGAMALLGETNFAVRVMSSLAAGLAAWALFCLLKGERGRKSASLAVYIFLTCGVVMGVCTFSVLDSMFSGILTAALCCSYLAWESHGRKQIGLLVLTGLFAGGAFLVKGFIAFAVPVVVIVPFLLIQRRWKELFLLSWIPVLSAIALILPWGLAVAAREPDFWHYFFWVEHIQRFFSQGNTQHQEVFWLYIPVFIVGTIPWSLIAPLPIRDLIRRRAHEPLIQFALSWLVMTFLFFSSSSGKLGTYILPCFAPFSLLLAIAFIDWFESEKEMRPFQIGLAIFGGVIGVALLALLGVGILNMMHRLPHMDSHFGLKFAGAVGGLSLALWSVIYAFRVDVPLRKVIFLGLSAATVFVTLTLCLPTEMSTSSGIQGFLESKKPRIEPDTIIVGDPKTMHALCYVFQRDDIYLFRGKGEVTYGLSYPDAEFRYLNSHQLLTLIHERGSRRLVLAIKARPDAPVKFSLPLPHDQEQWQKIWFVVYEPQGKE